jgi:hypothetical protein
MKHEAVPSALFPVTCSPFFLNTIFFSLSNFSSSPSGGYEELHLLGYNLKVEPHISPKIRFTFVGLHSILFPPLPKYIILRPQHNFFPLM